MADLTKARRIMHQKAFHTSIPGRQLYTCWGSVRGGCGIAHRSLQAAAACIRRDARGCKRQGGYSDREPREIDRRAEARCYDVRLGPGRPVPASWTARYLY